MKPLVPAYVWPTNEAAWQRALAGLTPPGIVVVTGDNSGPGHSRSDLLAERIGRLVADGWTCAGYVALAYGRRALLDVAKDVAWWRAWYPAVSAVFFDEAPTGGPDVRAACTALGALTPRPIFNCGAPVDTAQYRSVASAIWVTFEGSLASYPPDAMRGPRCAHLVYQGRPAWPKGLGWGYATTDGLDGNPWDAST